MPLLSIITINLNNATGLYNTIESVVNQTFTDYEFIIIDGASKDGSLEVLNKFKERITYWVSEPDNGIYNAMNKGIEISKGEYCIFLNSGDLFFTCNILAEISMHLINEDIIYGDIRFNLNNNRFNESNLPKTLTFYRFYTSTLFHQSTFLKRKLFEKYGKYNESLAICSDWEFLLKVLILNKGSYKYLNKTISIFNSDGISSRPESLKIIKEERDTILNKYFPLFIEDYKSLSILYNTPTGRLIKKISTHPKSFNFINNCLSQVISLITMMRLFFTRKT